MTIFIALGVGMSFGAVLGFGLCSMLTVAKESDKEMGIE